MARKKTTTDLAENFLLFADAIGLELFPWQRDAFGQATRRKGGRFVYRVAAVSVPRGNGKSFAAAAVAVWRLLFGGKQDIIGAALDTDGAKIIMAHAREIVRAVPELSDVIDRITASEIAIPETNSKWTTTTREHTASRGRHPTLVLYDECGWAKDSELFGALLAGQASAHDPLMLLTSTVGKKKSGPLWQMKELAKRKADPSVFWWWSGDNGSPLITKEFLARQRKILMPGQYAREHENTWVDAADSFASSADVDAAMAKGWIEQPRGREGIQYVAAVDIGFIHDPAVILVAHQEDGLLFVDRLLTFQGSREDPVQMKDLEAALMDLDGLFTLRAVRIESWQGIAAAQNLQDADLPVTLFQPTPKATSEEWPLLHQRLAERTLVLPAHARLREELLGLVYEVTASGVRVVDRGRVHQDHAVTLRMACAMLHEEETLDSEYTAPWGLGRRTSMTPVFEAELRRRARAAEQREEEEETPAVWGSDDREGPYRRP